MTALRPIWKNTTDSANASTTSDNMYSLATVLGNAEKAYDQNLGIDCRAKHLQSSAKTVKKSVVNFLASSDCDLGTR